MREAPHPTPSAPLSESVLPVARLVYTGSAAIYGVLGLIYVLFAPLEPHLALAGVFLSVGALFALVAFVMPRLRASWIEPTVLLSVAIAEAGAIAFVPLTGQPKQSVAVIIVILAAGAVVPTLRSSIAGVVIGILGWLVFAVGFPHDDLVHWLFNVIGAGVVSIAISAARLRAVADLQLTRFMIDRATDAIYLLSPERRFLYVNNAACTMLGYCRDELLGMTLDAIDPSATPARWQQLWDALRRREAFVVQTVYRAKDGRELPVEVSLNLATLDGHEYNCAIARDVTERRIVEDRLERARHAAESASRAKSEFLATMSHEIRTPLNGVFGMTELALETDDPDERRDFIRHARSSAETLLGLLNDILDHSRIEAGRLPLEELAFDPRELMAKVASALELDARQRGLALRAGCDADVPALLRGDPRRLRQILTNLAVNALKFTEHGEVELRLAVEKLATDAGVTDEREQQHVRLLGTVRDTGIGIAPGKLAEIFEPFTQVDSSDSRRYGGAGLGLAIVRELVTSMGGTIEATSVPGEGSTFRFHVRLPIVTASEASRAEISRAAG